MDDLRPVLPREVPSRPDMLPRKPFVAPKLERHGKLPEVTGLSGGICDFFPDAPDCP